MLVRQRRLDRGDTVLKLISGYVPAHELNLPLLTAIQEVAEECPGGDRRRLARRALRRHLAADALPGFAALPGEQPLRPHPAVRRRPSGASRQPALLERPRAYVHLPTASLQLVYDMRLELPRDAREPSLYHVDERLESGPLVARLDRRRPDLYLPLDQGAPPATCSPCAGQLRPAATRGLWLAESFAVQDGWLVHEERIRFRDWLALWPSSNGDQAGGGRDQRLNRAGFAALSTSTGWKTCRAGGERR